MDNKPLPKKVQERHNVKTAEELWKKLLMEGNVFMRRRRRLFALLPSNPRCVQCHRPFNGIGGAIFRLTTGLEKAQKNPRFCSGCYSFTGNFPGGAEVVLTMLFVDVRGSTTIAEQMNDTEFSRLMNRFYEVAINVLVRADAFIDKLVGDEVTALFIPGYAGEDHAAKAVGAGRELLKVTGHGKSKEPWVPVGVGIHTGRAWVGSIAGARGEAADFTALGDNVNVAARLASNAGPGEVLASEVTCTAAGVDTRGLEKRNLALKGKSEPVGVWVLEAA